jgi:hypothetical protein
MDGTTLALAGVKTAASTIVPAAQSLGMKAYNRLRVSLTKCFESSISASADRCRNIKNIIYKDEAVDLMSQYVSANFAREGESIRDDILVQNLVSGSRLLISGRAGFGKTMFMKWATVRLIDSQLHHQLYPIFLELRYLEEIDSQRPLAETLFERTSAVKSRPSFAQFEIGLCHGLFVVILDAVDEINPAFRDKSIDRMRDFMRDYPKCSVLVSTRPDESLEALQDFSVYRTVPMNMTQIKEVITRLSYDESVKEKLIGRLDNGLFEEHRGFLSNPLLATIMLLTYDHSADIPTKITSFYKEAFEVLYQRHDAHKGTFRRDHHAGLPMDEFESIFTFFCYDTFTKLKLEFSQSELILAFREAISFIKIEADPVKVTRDSIESVSLIQKDGLKFVFVHRSFQEYFAARFLVNYRGPGVADLIDSAALSMFGGNMLGMMLELNSDLLEYEWLLPKSEHWLKEVEKLRLTTKSGLKKFLEKTVDRLGYRIEGRIGSYSLSGDTGARWMSPIAELYGERRFSSRVFSAILPPISEVENLVETRLGKIPDSLRRFVVAASEGEDASSSAVRTDIRPSDAEWLIATNLPETCQAIRDDVIWLIAKVKKRREDLSKLVARMSQRTSD